MCIVLCSLIVFAAVVVVIVVMGVDGYCSGAVFVLGCVAISCMVHLGR